LKQAPRVWFHQFSSFLLHLGFTCNTIDSSIFVYARSNFILDLLLYVDDIVVTGNNTHFLQNFIQQLHREFSTNDLGTLNYFLGLEVSSFANGLFLSQVKYAHNILACAQLLDCKPTTTLMVVLKQLSSDGDAFTDPTLYHSMVGALQYLTITHPDLTHAVNLSVDICNLPRCITFKPLNVSFGMLRILFIMAFISLPLHLLVLLPTLTLIGLVALTRVAPPLVTQCFWVTISSCGVLRNNLLFLVLVVNLSIVSWLTQLRKLFG
jgi:hypothetical protein